MEIIMDNSLPVVGVEHEPGRQTGLARPVLGGLGGFWLQVSDDGRVQDFSPGDPDNRHTIPLSREQIGKLYRSVAIGDPVLHAFILPGVRVLLGSKAELAERLEDALPSLAADFIASAEAETFIAEARRCAHHPG